MRGAGSVCRSEPQEFGAGTHEENALQPAARTELKSHTGIGAYRWRICALLFFAATINYIDRQVLGVLAPDLERSLGWSESQYGYIVTAFQTAYAIAFLFAGRLMDRVGVRAGFSAAVVFWSLAAMAHAAVSSAFGFGVARFALGLGEAGNFPASIKTVAEWFPPRERALATGLFNAGTNVGAVVTPLVIPWIAARYGWRAGFLLTGTLGFFWVIAWITVYRRPELHPKVRPSELAYIQSEPPEPVRPVSWSVLLPHRQTWAFALGKFLTDPIWWFYLFWLPKFLHKTYGLTLDRIGLPLVAIYLAADIGSVGGGWLPLALINRGWSVNAARKTSLLVCALAVIPIMVASRASNMWVAVLFLGIATAAHQGWSANLYTIVPDMFPKRAVGTMIGLGGAAGATGGMLLATGAGLLLQYTGSYVPLFIIAGSAYLVALLVIQLLAPRLEPVPRETAA